MTTTLVDYASYQDGLRLADIRLAGATAVNFKVSHGLTLKSVHPKVAALAAEAKATGLHRASFHWLDKSASGKAQAEFAYAQMKAAGLDYGCPHFVDCESDATLAILTDYVTTMRALLGREVGIYTGDWWWAVRGWNGGGLSPYLMAAPNNGYLTDYPGDESPAWAAGWGQWTTISVLQYAVGRLRFPDGTSGKIDVSKAAVRDLAVWAALAGGQMTIPVCTTDDLEQFAGPTLPDPWTDARGWAEPSEILWRDIDLLPDNARTEPRARALTISARAAWILVASLVHMRAEFNQTFPDRDKASDGSIGDQAHQAGTSGHNPDEEGHSETTDSDSINEVRAIDIDSDLKMPGVTMEMVVQYLVKLCRAGTIKWIRYLIFNKRIWKASAGWVTQAYTGTSPHTEHLHVSCQPDTASENNTKSLGLATLVEDDIVDQAEFNTLMDGWTKSRFTAKDGAAEATVRNYWRAIAWQYVGGGIRTGSSTLNVFDRVDKTLEAVLNNVVADDGELADLKAAIAAAQQATVTEVLDGLVDAGRSDEEVAAALRAALGDRAADVGRLLTGTA